MSSYRFTPEFQKNIDFLDSRFLCLLDSLKIKHNSIFLESLPGYIKDDNHIDLSTGKKHILIENEIFYASTSGLFNVLDKSLVVNHHNFSTEISNHSDKKHYNKKTPLFKLIQSLKNGENLHLYIDHFLSFSKNFFDEVSFSIKVSLQENTDIQDITIVSFEHINSNTESIRRSSVLYNSSLLNLYNISTIDDILNFIELSFCFSYFEDFSKIMDNPSKNDLIRKFSDNKEDYIMLAKMYCV